MAKRFIGVGRYPAVLISSAHNTVLLSEIGERPTTPGHGGGGQAAVREVNNQTQPAHGWYCINPEENSKVVAAEILTLPLLADAEPKTVPFAHAAGLMGDPVVTGRKQSNPEDAISSLRSREPWVQARYTNPNCIDLDARLTPSNLGGLGWPGYPIANGTDFGKSSQEIRVGGWNSIFIDRIKAGVKKAREKMKVEWSGPQGQPSVDDIEGAKVGRRTSKVELGATRVEFDVEIPLAYDDETGVFSAVSGAEDPSLSGPFSEAARAMAAYNGQLKKAIAAKAEGQPYVSPGPRPAATTAAELTPDQREQTDNWWANVSAIDSAARTGAGPTADQAYQYYREGGGNQTRSAWDADRANRIDAAATATPATSGDWIDTLGSALGWAADKASSAVSWLGNSALALAKDWGPAGVVGAYAGVKAVNSADSGTFWNKWGAIFAVGLGALILLK